MNQIILNIIILLHFIFVLFIVLTPFFGNNALLILHSFIVPFMMLHWYLNNNTCFLTLMEKQIRKQIYSEEPKSEDCLSHKLVAPIYDFKKNNVDLEYYLYFLATGLWLVTLSRLYYNYSNGKLNSLYDIANY